MKIHEYTEQRLRIENDTERIAQSLKTLQTLPDVMDVDARELRQWASDFEDCAGGIAGVTQGIEAICEDALASDARLAVDLEETISGLKEELKALDEQAHRLEAEWRSNPEED